MLNQKKQNGFTMVELLASFVILGVIMAIAVPTISYFLKGNSKDYYNQLEKTVSSSGQDFFNDYRSNLPKDIGNIKKISIKDLQSQKYITEIKGIDKKDCDGDVVVQKLANGNYSYTACLKCEKKNNGNYEYNSSAKECGYSEENNNHYTILIDGLSDKTSIRIPQAENYTIPNAKVYVNGQAISPVIKPTPSTIDVNALKTYKIYYTFRALVKELQIKVYDPKRPVVNISALIDGSNYTSGTYTSKDVKINLSATDWTTTSVYGSGIDHFEYQINGGSIQKINATTTDNKTYTATFNITTNGTYNITVKAIDKEGNISDSKSFGVKIDKNKPTAPVITGGSTTWTNQNRTIKISKDATAPSGIKNYQYYISTSSTTQNGGSWINLSAGTKQVAITTEGIRYIFFRAISNSGVVGSISNSQPTRIDKTKPVITSVSGADKWISTSTKVIVNATDNLSGISAYSYDNGETWNSYNYNYFSTSKILQLGVKDNVGNITYGNYNIKVDKTKPTVNYTPPSTWTNQNRTLTIPVSDTESGIGKMQWGKGVLTETGSYTCDNTSYEFNNTFTTDVHVNCARITDKVGNVTQVWVHSKVDKIAPYTPWFNEEAIKNNQKNGYILTCKNNQENYYGINECILNHTQREGGYYISRKDLGGSGHGYEEIKDLYNGIVVKDWTRYKYGSTPPNLSFPGACKKEGQCIRWYRTIDNAGNVAKGYLIMHFIDSY